MAAILSPYLNFNGVCEEAMHFYQAVFGGKLEMTRFGDMPMEGAQQPSDKIMHSTLNTDDLTFMASDTGMGVAVMGDSMSMSIAGKQEDAAKIHGFYDGLSEGGKITMPLAEVPWGAEFGMLEDKFGIHWMFNIDKAPAA